MEQWVQHISKQGKIYHVKDDWTCWKEIGLGNVLKFPKDEYLVCPPPDCPPPESWVDVTDDCEIEELGAKGTVPGGHCIIHRQSERPQEVLARLVCGGRYRVKKVPIEAVTSVKGCEVNKWAFIVEKRVSHE